MQPEISSGSLTCPSFALISAEGMGEDNFLNIRSPNRRTLVEFTHLPDIESVRSKVIKFGLLLLLYLFLQLIHRVTHSNLNRERLVPTDNPTKEPELAI
jgi:hypothetical protein